VSRVEVLLGICVAGGGPVRRLIGRVAISMLSMFIALALLEAGIRIFRPQEINFWDSSSIRRLQSVPPHFVENIPNGRAMFIGVPVAIDSYGLRGDEVRIPKPTNTKRILAVGDSITFGYGIRVEDTYAQVLEKLLNNNASTSSQQYEVLNGGTLGGSLSDYYHFLTDKALALQPDIVVVGLALNDILIYERSGAISEIGSKWQGGQLPTIRRFNRFLLRHSHLYLYGFARLKSFVYGSRLLDINVVRGLDFAALAPPSPYQDHAWESSFEMLSRIRDLCRQRGYRFVVVVFPMQMQLSAVQLQFYRQKYHLNLSDDAVSGKPQQRLRQFAAQTGIDLVDLLPIYRIHESEGLYFHSAMIPADPTHPSARGNHLIAEQICNEVLSTNSSKTGCRN
jgi:lysophospholipase L1-like esterase